RERQLRRIPQLDLVSLAVPRLGEGALGRGLSEQPDGRRVQIALILFQADDQVPADLFRPLEGRGLSVESIQQEEVEETAAVEVGDFVQQAQGGGVLALAGLHPLQGQKGLDRATDDWAAHRPVVVLYLFDFHALLPRRDATFEAGVAATAV